MKIAEFRCANCGRLLAKTNGDTEIKCPRCGAINRYIAVSGKVEYIPKAQHRVTSSGATFTD